MSVYNSGAIALATAGAYIAGDVVGGVLTFTGAARTQQGLVAHVALFDDAAQKKAIDLILFRAAPSATPADNAAFALQSGDEGKVIAVMSIAEDDYADLGSGAAVATLKATVAIPQSPDGNLYARLVTRGTPTYATGNLRVEIGIVF